MNSRQRVLSAFDRRGYDRIPVKHEGTPEVNRMLMDHFGLKNMEQLLCMLGDDFRYIEPLYCGPELKTFPDGSVEGYFGERYKYAQFEAGRYLEACYLPFAAVNRLEDLDRSHFPIGRLVRLLDRPPPGRGLAGAAASPSASAPPATWTSSTVLPGHAAWSRCSWTCWTTTPVYLAIMQARLRVLL